MYNHASTCMCTYKLAYSTGFIFTDFQLTIKSMKVDWNSCYMIIHVQCFKILRTWLYLVFVQIHLEFIQVCMQQLQLIYESLQQYKPGEIEQEPPEVQQGCKAEVGWFMTVALHCCCSMQTCWSSWTQDTVPMVPPATTFIYIVLTQLEISMPKVSCMISVIQQNLHIHDYSHVRVLLHEWLLGSNNSTPKATSYEGCWFVSECCKQPGIRFHTEHGRIGDCPKSARVK